METSNRQNASSQIFCLSWVKRGDAKSKPEFIELSPTELDALKSDESTQDQCESEVDKVKKKSTKNNGKSKHRGDMEGDLDEYYDLDNYDDEIGDMQGFNGIYVYSNNADDPYLTKTDENELADSGDEEEKVSTVLKPDDNLLLCARCSEHSNILEVFVYNHSTKDFYVHHDMPLMETPLCMQWIGFDPGAEDNEKGNLVALGNFNSTIDIWDVDVMNTLEPILTIGRNCNVNLKKTKKKRKFCHNDAILDLSWTDSVKDNLASASADGMVALWDLEMVVATNVFKDHSTKVQSIEWKPCSSSNLCSGSFDGKVYILDKKTNASCAEWQVDGEVERIRWNCIDSNYFVVGTDKGMVYYLDCRKPSSSVLEWQAHEQPIPCLSIFNVESETFLSTGSSDGLAKIWDLGNVNEKIPTMIFDKHMKIGMVHCSQVNPNENLVIAYGGQKDAIRLWDLSQTNELSLRFGLSKLSDTVPDTLMPEGGGGENDDEVSKYVDGVDYYVSKF